MKRSIAALAIGATAFAVAAANAHPEHADRLANAQVLDPHTPKEDVTALMKHFTQALGVRCSYCHVGEEGAPLSTYDFASDAKAEKRRAREMMRLTMMINESDMLPGEPFASHTAMDRNRVNCITCHQGNTRPATTLPEDAPDAL
ncbi:c-type cytochrome [Sphingomicrobium sediminis]|uniref:Photosynthetic reaction center cytochrome c subunit n=1 Tax=Sphingomicrobium sediminis TaxID=2950949 RepID=A0A9X2J2R1_9SPHN|nr:c-type cytochrome [Sphingomicrobium sediminis]MCM8557290.1 c-type cytochrome [Sphingomicrobium sediminis]